MQRVSIKRDQRTAVVDLHGHYLLITHNASVCYRQRVYVYCGQAAERPAILSLAGNNILAAGNITPQPKS
jgi:hypothetical protein